MTTKISRSMLNVITSMLLMALLVACAEQTPPQQALDDLSQDDTAPLIDAPPPTLAPAGLPDNPLQFVFVPEDAEAATEYIDALEDAILEVSSVTVQITLARNNADALAALCATTPENVVVAFLDGFAWLAAEAQNCGDAVLRLQASNRPNAPIGEPVHILLNDSYRSTDLTLLQGRAFCRLAVDDALSWLVPNLIFRSEGINVATFDTIRNYPDYDTLLTALATGDCDGASLPQSLYRAYDTANDERIGQVRIARTTPTLPYGVLVYPSQIPLAARLSLTEGLLRLFVLARSTVTDPEATPDPLDPEATPEPQATPEDWFSAFFGERGVGRMSDNDFTELRAFIQQNRLNLDVLGQ